MRVMCSLVLLLVSVVPALAEDDIFAKEAALESQVVPQALELQSRGPVVLNLAAEAATGGYKLVDAAGLKKLLAERPDTLVIDTMPYEASYLKGHVPGARQFLFPIPAMAEWKATETDGKSQEDFARLLGEKKDRPVVVYCGFVKCTRSHNGALWARKLGYTDVYRFPGGIYAWRGLKYPVEEGPAK